MYLKPFNINHLFIFEDVEFHTLDLKNLLSSNLTFTKYHLVDGVEKDPWIHLRWEIKPRFRTSKEVYQEIVSQPSLVCFTYAEESSEDFSPYLTLVSSLKSTPQGGQWLSHSEDKGLEQFKISNSGVLSYRNLSHGWKVLLKGSFNKLYAAMHQRLKVNNLYQINEQEIRKLK